MQDSVLAESLHGPSVPQNKTPVKVFDVEKQRRVFLSNIKVSSSILTQHITISHITDVIILQY